MEELQRTEALIGKEALDKLASKKVIVFGVGGVGGHACEALARCGLLRLDLVDGDVVSVSNINRQIVALRSTVGKYKAEVMKERIADISEKTQVKAYNVFFSEETKHLIDLSKYDYIVDAIDTVSSKLLLIEMAKELNVPIISSMGAGNKLNPCAFKVADIYKTSVCPLARAMRTELKKRGIKSLKVVFSDEPPYTSGTLENGKRVPSSISFVPSTAGLVIASEVVKDLIK